MPIKFPYHMRILFFLLILFPQLSPAQSTVWPEKLEVTASALKLRDAPNLDSKTLATMPQGAILENLGNVLNPDLVWQEIDGKGAYWMNVQYQGQTGFVFGAYVTPLFNLFFEDISIEYLPNVKNWYGMYDSPKGDELRKIEVHTTLDSNEMSGDFDLTLRSHNPEKSKFIIGTNRTLKTGITGNFFNRYGEASMHLSNALELISGKTISLNSLYMTEISYDLMCTGSFELEPKWLVQRDFKIWITKRLSPNSNISVKQNLLIFIKDPQETYTVKWFGDLDGDGNPDMLMGMCGREGGCIDMLFLSTAAKNGELLRPVTVYSWGFGC